GRLGQLLIPGSSPAHPRLIPGSSPAHPRLIPGRWLLLADHELPVMIGAWKALSFHDRQATPHRGSTAGRCARARAAACPVLVGARGELRTAAGLVPGLRVGARSGFAGAALAKRLVLLAHLVDLVADDGLALVIEAVGLRLSDSCRLLDGGALPHLASLGHDLVELLAAGTGAEHVAHPKTGDEHQFAAHCASFLAVWSILPPSWRRGQSVPQNGNRKPGGDARPGVLYSCRGHQRSPVAQLAEQPAVNR